MGYRREDLSTALASCPDLLTTQKTGLPAEFRRMAVIYNILLDRKTRNQFDSPSPVTGTSNKGLSSKMLQIRKVDEDQSILATGYSLTPYSPIVGKEEKSLKQDK